MGMDEVQGLLVVDVVAGVAEVPCDNQEEERNLLGNRHSRGAVKNSRIPPGEAQIVL
jgi:hypothetical protein